MSPSPRILVIDDEPEDQRATFRLAPDGEAVFGVFHPEEVDHQLLQNADLVLVDYIIDTWQARSAASQIGLRPVNGIALAAVLREQANLVERPTGDRFIRGRRWSCFLRLIRLL